MEQDDYFRHIFVECEECTDFNSLCPEGKKLRKLWIESMREYYVDR